MDTPAPAYRFLVERLGEARRQSGLTQAQVAAVIDRPQSYVAKYEAGERRLDVVELLQVAQALDLDPVRLVRDLMRVGQTHPNSRPGSKSPPEQPLS